MLKSLTLSNVLNMSIFSKTYIVALVGKPGTGKSYHSQRIVFDLKLELIIDDGLLIKDRAIIGGRSAKSDRTRISATKTALFLDENHCISAKNCIQKNKIRRILILGTSLKMVDKITERLELGKIKKIIKIEEILSSGEIQLAQSQRKKLGRHIIPVPAIEIRKRYPSIFLGSIGYAINKYVKNNLKIDVENSIVRPKFSKDCTIFISENAIRQMITEEVYNINSDIIIRSLKIKWKRCEACRIYLNVAISCLNNISKDFVSASENIKSQIESNIGIVVENIDITIESMQKHQKKDVKESSMKISTSGLVDANFPGYDAKALDIRQI
ncbi:MAG TPA: hypothetical protein VHP36_04020 [Chitinispirillaceae bacterium]|nr:hypothetical protein [Chitinispirillaceae bacterium]